MSDLESVLERLHPDQCVQKYATLLYDVLNGFDIHTRFTTYVPVHGSVL